MIFFSFVVRACVAGINHPRRKSRSNINGTSTAHFIARQAKTELFLQNQTRFTSLLLYSVGTVEITVISSNLSRLFFIDSKLKYMQREWYT